jgi:hypothetical protein
MMTQWALRVYSARIDQLLHLLRARSKSFLEHGIEHQFSSSSKKQILSLRIGLGTELVQWGKRRENNNM